MPPKVKVSKEAIVQAALELVRTHGAHSINARNVAAMLGCSTQPIFSNFATMDLLKMEVVDRADQLCQTFMQKETESGQYPPYKASGMGYIRFAKEEKALFQLLYMRERAIEDHATDTEKIRDMITLVHNNTGLEDARAQLFHLEMWAFVHGIATMFATGYLNLDWALVSDMLTDAYQGLRKRYETE